MGRINLTAREWHGLLHESCKAGRLLLVDGAVVRYNARRRVLKVADGEIRPVSGFAADGAALYAEDGRGDGVKVTPCVPAGVLDSREGGAIVGWEHLGHWEAGAVDAFVKEVRSPMTPDACLKLLRRTLRNHSPKGRTGASLTLRADGGASLTVRGVLDAGVVRRAIGAFAAACGLGMGFPAFGGGIDAPFSQCELHPRDGR